MEAVEFLTQWIHWLFLIIPAGAAAMVTYQSYRKIRTSNQGEISDCNTKIKNTIRGAIIAVTITGVVEIVKSFYV